MRYIQEIGITNKSVSGDRGAYGFLSVLSRRAHLLTTASDGVSACGMCTCLRQTCALRGSVSVLLTETANLLWRLNTAIFTLR